MSSVVAYRHFEFYVNPLHHFGGGFSSLSFCQDLSLVDPTGFQRVEDSYQSAGAPGFWSPEVYAYGRRARQLRLLMIAAALLVMAAGADLGRKRGLF